MLEPRLICYSAVFGGKDEPPVIRPQPGVEARLFTDDPDMVAPGWTVVHCLPIHADPTRDARMYKILPHRHLGPHDVSIWLDANIVSTEVDFVGVMQQYALAGSGLASFPHPHRKCIYEEAKACRQLKKDAPAIIRRQMSAYAESGMPADLGLIESSVLIRRNCPEVNQFCEDWWREIALYSRRDQLSFNFVAWKRGFQYDLLPGDLATPPALGFRRKAHKIPEGWQAPVQGIGHHTPCEAGRLVNAGPIGALPEFLRHIDDLLDSGDGVTALPSLIIAASALPNRPGIWQRLWRAARITGNVFESARAALRCAALHPAREIWLARAAQMASVADGELVAQYEAAKSRRDEKAMESILRSRRMLSKLGYGKPSTPESASS